MKSIEELQGLIIDWAKDKDLIKEENAPKQYLKFLSEVGETADAILKNDVPEIKDGFGDIAVTIIILAAQIQQPIDLGQEGFNVISGDPDDFGELFDLIHFTYVSSLAIEQLWNLSKDYGYDLTECLNLAWSEIKDRKGETKNGTFIKS